MASKMTRKDYLKSTAGGLLSVALLSKLGMQTQAAPVTDNLRSDGNSTGGGSTVEWNQIQDSGSKIAQITIDGTTTDVFAPNGSGGGGRTETLLASGTYLKNDTVLLSEDYNKFDELVFITKNTNPDGFITNYIIKKSTTDYAVADDLKLELYGYANCFITLKFLDSRTISVLDGVGTILQVSGIKFVSGGSETEMLVLTPTQFENLSPLPESGIIGVTSSDSSALIKKFYDMSKYVDIEYDENVWNGVSAVSYVNIRTANDLIHEDTVSGYNVFCVLAENVLNSSYRKYDTLTVNSIEQMPIRRFSNTLCISSGYFSSDSGTYKATSYSEGNNWNNQAIIFARVPWNNCEFVQDFFAGTAASGYFEYVADNCGYYLIPITTGGQNEHSITVETDGFKKELQSAHSYGRYADLFGVFLKIGQKLKITYTVAGNTTSYLYCGIYYMK